MVRTFLLQHSAHDLLFGDGGVARLSLGWASPCLAELFELVKAYQAEVQSKKELYHPKGNIPSWKSSVLEKAITAGHRTLSPHLEGMPRDTQNLLLEQCDALTLCRLSCTSSIMYRVASSNWLWQRIYVAHFPISPLQTEVLPEIWWKDWTRIANQDPFRYSGVQVRNMSAVERLFDHFSDVKLTVFGFGVNWQGTATDIAPLVNVSAPSTARAWTIETLAHMLRKKRATAKQLVHTLRMMTSLEWPRTEDAPFPELDDLDDTHDFPDMNGALADVTMIGNTRVMVLNTTTKRGVLMECTKHNGKALLF